MPRKPGRPRFVARQIKINLSKAENRALAAIMKAGQWTVSQAVRAAILKYPT